MNYGRSEAASNGEGGAGERLRARLVGHEKAAQLLLKCWAEEKLHHAWCISGPKGIGKSTLAWQFAYFLLDHEVPGAAEGQSLFGDKLPAIAPGAIKVDPQSGLFQRLQASA